MTSRSNRLRATNIHVPEYFLYFLGLNFNPHTHKVEEEVSVRLYLFTLGRKKAIHGIDKRVNSCNELIIKRDKKRR